MSARPKSVTIIAWILLVAGALSLFLGTLILNDPKMKEDMSKSPIPIPLQLVLMYAGLGFSMASGIGMLKAKEWSRRLYTGWGVLSLTISTLTSPEKLLVIPGLVVFLVIVFFLFRPAATLYFTKKPQS